MRWAVDRAAAGAQAWRAGGCGCNHHYRLHTAMASEWPEWDLRPLTVQLQGEGKVRCAEAAGDVLLVGSTDGWVRSYARQPSPGDAWTLAGAVRASRTGKAVERIILLPVLGLAAVLAEGSLSFYHLPDLRLVSRDQVPTVRGVSLIVSDERVRTEPDLQWLPSEGIPSVSLALVRRKNIALIRLSLSSDGKLDWLLEQDVSLPVNPLAAARWGPWMLIATLEEYQLVDLRQGMVVKLGLPISQVGATPSAATRPAILALPRFSPRSHRAKRAVFVVTSHAPDGSLGVFVDPFSGDIQPLLIEWPAHPRSLTLALLPQSQGRWRGHIVALLRNDRLQAHEVDVGYGTTQLAPQAEVSADTQRSSYPAQLLVDTPLPPACADARFLSSGKNEFHLFSPPPSRATSPAGPTGPWDLPYLLSQGEPVDDDAMDDAAWATHLTTPIADPSRPYAAPASFMVTDRGGKASILLGTADGLFVVSRPTLASRARPLLRSGRMGELSFLLDSLPGSAWDHSSQELAQTLSHIVGWVHLRALRFEPGIKALIRASAPLSWAIELFPELIAELPPLHASPEEVVTVPSCVAGCYPRFAPHAAECSLTAIIRDNLVLNYEPLLTVPSVAELRSRLDPLIKMDQDSPIEQLFDALSTSARTHLAHWIHGAQRDPQQAHLAASQETARTLSTVLAQIYALAPVRDTQSTITLHSLLPSDSVALPAEEADSLAAVDWVRVRPILVGKSKWHPLARLAQAQGESAAFLSLATALVDGSKIDLSLRVAWAEHEYSLASQQQWERAQLAAHERSVLGQGLERVPENGESSSAPPVPLSLKPLVVNDVLSALQVAASPELVQEYASWVSNHAEPAEAVAALSQASSVPADAMAHHEAVLMSLRTCGKGEVTARLYLEQAALDPQAPMDLRRLLLKNLLNELHELLASGNEVVFSMLSLQRAYQGGMYEESFFAHLALHATPNVTEEASFDPAMGTPNERAAQAVRTRIKVILLLQAFALELVPPDGPTVPQAAEQCESLLAQLAGVKEGGEHLLTYEQAILLGPLGRHAQALTLLTTEVGDTNSAETYCLLLGVVVSPLVAKRVAGMLAPAHRSSRARGHRRMTTAGAELTSLYGHGPTLALPPGRGEPETETSLQLEMLPAYARLLALAAASIGPVAVPSGHGTGEVDQREADRRDLFMALLKVYTQSPDRYVLRAMRCCAAPSCSAKTTKLTTDGRRRWGCAETGGRCHCSTC